MSGTTTNRPELSRGGDLQLEPGPAVEPINFLACPVLEVGGRQKETDVFFAFRRDTDS